MPAADHPVPRHPGRILLEDYLIPMRLSQYDAAKRLYAPESTVNGMVAGTEKLTWQAHVCGFRQDSKVLDGIPAGVG